MKIKTKKVINNFEGYVYNFSVEDNHNYIVQDLVVSNCHYCYTSALKTGSNFDNIVEKAKIVYGNLPENERPFQIAIGEAGESTIHPDWVEFVKTIKSLGIVPNYTTNGMHLTPEILEGTKLYCGGVAVSYHPHIKETFNKAIQKLTPLAEYGIKINAHIIVGDKKSFFDLQSIYETYKDVIDYFVVLPYQAAGRAVEIETHETWKATFEWINTVQSNKFAFGALFYNWLKLNKIALKMSIYEPEMFSGYRLMDDSYKKLRKSSYDLTEKQISI